MDGTIVHTIENPRIRTFNLLRKSIFVDARVRVGK